MKNHPTSIITIALLSTALLTMAAARDEKDFTPLFNGKDLAGKATGSEIDNKVTEPGPIFLQGDHGTVYFRNVSIKELPKE